MKVIVRPFPPPGTDTEDSLYYSPQRKLIWSDFKGKVLASSPSDAVTFTGFSYGAAVIPKKDTLFVHLDLQIYFDKLGSWVRPEGRTAYALSHEQLHFDIARLWAGRFRDTLLTANFSPAGYDSDIHFLFWDYWRKMTDMEMRFDEETHHGANHPAENRWSDYIRKLLLSDSDPGLPHDE